MTQKIPNIQFRAWRDSNHLTRVEMADALNRTDTGQQAKLNCDEKRVARWETGEVLWPHAIYRRALRELTGRDAEDLGFTPQHRRSERPPLVGAVVPRDALQAEAEIFDTLELTRLAEISDIGAGTMESLNETADLLCRAYPSTPAATLRDRTKRRLQHVIRLLGGRSTLDQHRELLVVAAWLAVLLGCLHYDLGEREEAEAARQRYRGEQLARDFHERHLHIRRLIESGELGRPWPGPQLASCAAGLILALTTVNGK